MRELDFDILDYLSLNEDTCDFKFSEETEQCEICEELTDDCVYISSRRLAYEYRVCKECMKYDSSVSARQNSHVNRIKRQSKSSKIDSRD